VDWANAAIDAHNAAVDAATAARERELAPGPASCTWPSEATRSAYDAAVLPRALHDLPPLVGAAASAADEAPTASQGAAGGAIALAAAPAPAPAVAASAAVRPPPLPAPVEAPWWEVAAAADAWLHAALRKVGAAV
jgi:hypothetical protein